VLFCHIIAFLNKAIMLICL